MLVELQARTSPDVSGPKIGYAGIGWVMIPFFESAHFLRRGRILHGSYGIGLVTYHDTTTTRSVRTPSLRKVFPPFVLAL